MNKSKMFLVCLCLVAISFASWVFITKPAANWNNKTGQATWKEISALVEAVEKDQAHKYRRGLTFP